MCVLSLLQLVVNHQHAAVLLEEGALLRTEFLDVVLDGTEFIVFVRWDVVRVALEVLSALEECSSPLSNIVP